MLRLDDHGVQPSGHHELLPELEQCVVALDGVFVDFDEFSAVVWTVVGYDWEEDTVYFYDDYFLDCDDLVCSCSEYDELHLCSSGLWIGCWWDDGYGFDYYE